MNVPLEELRQLTGATHKKKVIRGLLELGVPYKVVNGQPTVLRSEVQRALSAAPTTATDTAIDMAARIARARGGPDGKKTRNGRRPA